MNKTSQAYRLHDAFATPDLYYVFLAGDSYTPDELLFEGPLLDCREWLIENKGKRYKYLDDITMWRDAPDVHKLITVDIGD